MMKRIWKYLRVVLFLVLFFALAASILPTVILMGMGVYWPLCLYLVSFVLGFIIHCIESRLGWIDEYGGWIND